MRSDNENLLDILRHIKQHYQYQFYLLASTLQLLSKVITDAQCISRNCNNVQAVNVIKPTIFFFYLGFLSRTFTIHGTAGEGGGYLFSSSLSLPPASQTLRH